MNDKHTATPWKRTNENAYSILTENGGLIAKTSYHWVDPLSARLNAEFIVQACNDHEKHTRLLSSIQHMMSGTEWNADTLESIAEVMREAGYAIGDLCGE